MPPGFSINPALREEIEAINALYLSLARHLDSDEGIGGRLILAGELDSDGARLVRAANIAGAASICATSNFTAQRQAIREGVVDFLVTSVDEALRILKNEIRKRNAVAVCVAVPPAQMVEELIERGVLPDLLRKGTMDQNAAFAAQGAQIIEALPLPPDRCLVIQPLPAGATDQRMLDLIPEADHAARRWLRLSPRYLGPQARKIRSLYCDPATGMKLEPRT